MEYLTQNDAQKDEAKKKIEEININKSKERQIKENINNKEGEDQDKFEEENPEDFEIQVDEFQRMLIGGADHSNKNHKYNSKTGSPSKSKKQNKKPFIATVIEGSSYKTIKVVINACSFKEEMIMPVWCPKGNYIHFKVKGKWRIDKFYPYTDSKGLPSNNKGGFGYGALIGRIGINNEFVISDNKIFIVNEEGPLYMRQMLPKNMKVEPEGSIEVFIYDVEYMKIDEINQKIGWIENNPTNENEQNEIFDEKKISKNKIEENFNKEFANKIRNEMNNLRINPIIFYDQYINKTKNLTKTREYLEKLQSRYIGVLNPIDDYYEAILNYFGFYTEKASEKKVNKGNVINYLLEIEGELECFLTDKFQRKTKVKCLLTQKTNAKNIIIQCFYNKKYRFYIFNKKCLDLCVNVLSNFYKDLSLIIMAFALEPPPED